MPLLNNEFARRENGRLELRPGPMRVRWLSAPPQSARMGPSFPMRGSSSRSCSLGAPIFPDAFRRYGNRPSASGWPPTGATAELQANFPAWR